MLAEHAVANWISPYVERWCPEEDEYYWWDTEKRERVIKSKGPLENDVPMTMKHWRILARLGEEPVRELSASRQDSISYLWPVGPRIVSPCSEGRAFLRRCRGLPAMRGF